MILPVVRERLEKLLRLASVEAALAAVHSGDPVVQLSGLQPAAKALLTTFFAGELRRPAFFLVASNKQAEESRKRCDSSLPFFRRETLAFFRHLTRCRGTRAAPTQTFSSGELRRSIVWQRARRMWSLRRSRRHSGDTARPKATNN